MKNQKESSTGNRLGVLVVILNYGIARIFPGPAVHYLVSALGSHDENTSTVAYMVLVKLGPRISTYLLHEARKGHQTANVLQVLGDHEDRRIIPEIDEFTRSPDPAVASAARKALEILLNEESG